MAYYRRKPLNLIEKPALDGARSVTRPERPLSAPTEPQKDLTSAEATPSSSMQEAAALVQMAASILDEEMASGVLAARDARPSPFEASSMPDENAANAPEQWLRHVHDLVDILAPLLIRTGEPLSQLTKSLTSTQKRLDPTGPEIEQAPVLRARETVHAGDQATISLKLHNDDTQPARLTLRASDLLSSTGYRIPEGQVVFTPSEIQLAPDASTAVSLQIGVPQGTLPGTYTGLLIASGLAYFRAVLILEVT